MIRSIKKQRSGQSLIEIIIAISLVAILTPALMGGLVTSRQSKPQQKQRLLAMAAMKEAKEAVLSVREKGWSHISTNGTFHPEVNSQDNSWQLSSGEETMPSGLRRKIDIGDVLRDSSGTIVLSGGTYTDPSTKRVVITISWDAPSSTTIVSTSYVTRHDNLSYTQTTQATFEAGIKANTFTTNVDDGEVILGSGGGGGDWCTPSQSITTVDLSRQGVPTAISAMSQNNINSIVTGTGGNASGPTFSNYTVTGNDPVTTEFRGEYDNSKANGVFRDPENFAYIATTDHSEEVKILDLAQYSNPPTNTKFLKVGWFDAPGNKDGQSVFVLGTVGYMTSDNKFYTFDLTSKTNSRPRYGTFDITLAGNGKKIVVMSIGNDLYAFVAVDSTSTQMEVFRVTDPANPVKVAQVQTGNGKPGVDISLNSVGTRAYLVTPYVAGLKDFFVINTSTLSGNLPLIGNGYDTGGMSPKGVAMATANRAIIVGTGGTNQYIVLNLEDENNPVACGPGLTITNGANAISTVLQDDGYAYAYVVTGDANAELKIILGGAGGQYATSGTFESFPYDNTVSTTFNSFTAHVSQPDSTLLKMRVAVANAVDGSCDDIVYNYLGPGGSTTQDFLIGSDPTYIRGAIPITTNGTYANPGQCFRYKVWFSTTSTDSTPVLYDMTVNYAP